MNVGGVAVILFVAALVAGGCGDGAGDGGPRSTPEETALRATVVAAATAGLIPEGLIVSTATPDLRSARSVSEAMAELSSADARFASLFNAVDAGDVDGLLDLFNFELRAFCQDRATECDEARRGEAVPMMLNGPVTFYVSVPLVRRQFAQALLPPALSARIIARSRAEPSKHVLFLFGASKGPTVAPFGSGDTDLSGVRLTFDAATEKPVVHFDGLTVGWTPDSELPAINEYEILAFAP